METAADLMTQRLVVVLPAAPIGEVLSLLRQKHIRHIPVVGAGNRLLGVISHVDLLRFGGDSPRGAGQARLSTAAQFMTPDPESVAPETCGRQVAQRLRSGGHSCLLVVGPHRELLGIITEADFVMRYLSGPAGDCDCPQCQPQSPPA